METPRRRPACETDCGTEGGDVALEAFDDEHTIVSVSGAHVAVVVLYAHT
jgi:hypothetical protein